jgi:hypothetical protein
MWPLSASYGTVELKYVDELVSTEYRNNGNLVYVKYIKSILRIYGKYFKGFYCTMAGNFLHNALEWLRR